MILMVIITFGFSIIWNHQTQALGIGNVATTSALNAQITKEFLNTKKALEELWTSSNIANEVEQLKKTKTTKTSTHTSAKKWKTISKNQSIIKYGWKDKMFSYNHWVWQDKAGYTWVDYQQKRDLEDRDFIDIDQAFPEWVDLSLKSKEWVVDMPAIGDKVPTTNTIPAYGIGKNIKEMYTKKNQYKFIFVFIHWLNGNRTWGFKDWTFNWNFNRLKHLAYYNNGLYVSPTITNFTKQAPQVSWFLKLMKEINPNAKLIIACWSSGGNTCWKVYWDTSTPLDGMLLLGSLPSPWGNQLIKKRNIPIYLGHWGKDRTISTNSAIGSYKQIKGLSNNPVKLELFTNGVHWTPLRMVDYLKVLQWMFNEENNTVIDKWAKVKPAQEIPTKVAEIYPS